MAEVIPADGVFASLARCFTGDGLCCRMCKPCCNSEDASDSPGQSTTVGIVKRMVNICTWFTCRKCCENCTCCGDQTVHVYQPVETIGQETEMTAFPDTRGATASGDERTLLPSNTEDHTGTRNVEPTPPPEEDTGLDSSPVTNQPTSRVSAEMPQSHQTADQPTISAAGREGQSSASHDSVHAAESQQTADPSAVGSTATREGQLAASHDAQPPAMNPDYNWTIQQPDIKVVGDRNAVILAPHNITLNVTEVPKSETPTSSSSSDFEDALDF